MGSIILFDDEVNTLKSFTQLFSDLKINNELITCNNLDAYRSTIADETTQSNLRALILDLAKDEKEALEGKFEIGKDIKQNFNEYRIPIFIHSGNLTYYNDFQDSGTVFKIEKSKDSVEAICTMIKLMEDSGFIELFPQNGKIESTLMIELHESFTKQFKENDIKNIIDSIEGTPEEKKQRVSEVFMRIAVRALISKLLNPVSEKDFNIKIHGIEHFLRRQNEKELWTGDIFINKKSDKKIIVLTPRCDVSDKDPISVAFVNDWNDVTRKNIQQYIVDNIKYRHFRYIPKTPLFSGGVVDFRTYTLMSRKEILENYSYSISLSDDLTNDIMSKYCSYILRTGIEEVNIEEIKNHFLRN